MTSTSLQISRWVFERLGIAADDEATKIDLSDCACVRVCVRTRESVHVHVHVYVRARVNVYVWVLVFGEVPFLCSNSYRGFYATSIE